MRRHISKYSHYFLSVIITCIPHCSSVVVARTVFPLFAIQVLTFLFCLEGKKILIDNYLFILTMVKIQRSCEQLLTAYLVQGSIPLFHKILNTKAAISATNKMVPPAIPSAVSIPKTVQEIDINYTHVSLIYNSPLDKNHLVLVINIQITILLFNVIRGRY